MDWILKLLPKLLTNRFIKSVVRYGIASVITLLQANKDLVPGLDLLAEFLQVNADQLADILTVIFAGFLALWSVLKNNANRKIAAESK